MRIFYTSFCILFCLTLSATAQQTSVSTINLKVSNVCEHFGQIIGLNSPGSSGSMAAVGERNMQAVVQAADVCPGECIFIELDDPVPSNGSA